MIASAKTLITNKIKVDFDEMGSASEEVIFESKFAFNRKTQTHTINLENDHQPATVREDYVCTILERVQNTINKLLSEAISENKKILVVLNLEGTFVDHEYKTFNFDEQKEICSALAIEQYLDKSKEKIIAKFKRYDSKYTGRKRLLNLQLHIHKVVKYYHHMDLKKIEKHIIDFKIDDDMSFKRSVLAALYPDVESSDSGKKLSENINMDSIDYPVQLGDIPLIEENNNFSVNVYMLKYSYETNSFEIAGPVYHTQGYKEKHVNLLFVHDKEKYRYCCIKDLKSLIKKQSPKSNFCESCLNFFDNAGFSQHQQEECLKVKVTIPKEKVIEFSNQKLLDKSTPFVVYADFQVILESDEQTQDKQEYGDIWTKNIVKHVPYSFWYYIKCADDDVLNSKKLKPTYKGLDCVSKFIDDLVKDLKKYLLIYKQKNPEDPIGFVPVFIHDLQNYEGHFILQNSKCDSVIDKLDTYFAIYKNMKIDSENIQLRFLDTLKFFNEPLLTSVGNLEEEDFKEIKKLCKNTHHLALLINKSGFPNLNIESLDRLKEKSLPEINQFEDFITKSPISEQQYRNAKEIWNKFQHKTVCNYSDLYLQSQVLLLADVFEKFRRFCRQNYQLDPAYYYSLAGFSWDAMLKESEVKLELLTDIEMLLFIKKGIRGGFQNCKKQAAIASNKYLKQNVGQGSGEESYIMYFDANGAYPYAMCKPLPYGGFEWVNDDNEKDECLNSLQNYNDAFENSEIGYILEVDLIYPKELHKKHSDFPFCPKRITATETGDKRLIADLSSKSKYVIHYTYLALCLKHGLKIDKVHRILKFKQSRWAQKFIEGNNEKRINSRNKSEKLLFKMMNITVYGKTIVNPEKYGNIMLFDRWDNNNKIAFDYITRPDYSSHVICSENVIEVKQRITNLTFKYPIYAGFTILDLAKTRMYEFYYNFMKEKFGDNMTLLYTDNDSFIFEIQGIDCYQTIKEYGNEIFDTSEYKTNNPFGIPQQNKLKAGYFKDVMNGAVINEYVGLRPKMYIIEAVEIDERGDKEPVSKKIKVDAASKKVKSAALGVPAHIRNKYGVEDYKKSRDGSKPLYEIFRRTKAVDHVVYTQEVRKKCLYAQNMI